MSFVLPEVGAGQVEISAASARLRPGPTHDCGLSSLMT